MIDDNHIDNKILTKITVLITCHNRREITLDCLSALFKAKLPKNIALHVFLVDDGSTDGTTEAVIKNFSSVTVIPTDGSFFWNRAMHHAQEIAITQQPDFLLWLNDDTIINEDAIIRLLDTYSFLYKLHGPTIVVGATEDRKTGKITYGGSVSISRLRRFTYRKVWSATDPVECETMNGNIVLLPMQVVRRVGNLDPIFEHAMGDTDYALRARKAGFHVFVAPGYVGKCSNNCHTGTYFDSTLPFSVRWKKILSRKGLPVRSWLQLTRKHGGILWPIYFAWPYVRLMISSLPRSGKFFDKNL